MQSLRASRFSATSQLPASPVKVTDEVNATVSPGSAVALDDQAVAPGVGALQRLTAPGGRDDDGKVDAGERIASVNVDATGSLSWGSAYAAAGSNQAPNDNPAAPNSGIGGYYAAMATNTDFVLGTRVVFGYPHINKIGTGLKCAGLYSSNIRLDQILLE